MMYAVARQEEPPCAFCVFLLGSLGRKEGTRNSDIEFGILTQSDSEEVIRWFHDFTVAHLKSKILLHVGIPFDEGATHTPGEFQSAEICC